MYWHRVCPEFWLAIQQLYIFIGVCVCVVEHSRQPIGAGYSRNIYLKLFYTLVISFGFSRFYGNVRNELSMFNVYQQVFYFRHFHSNFHYFPWQNPQHIIAAYSSFVFVLVNWLLFHNLVEKFYLRWRRIITEYAELANNSREKSVCWQSEWISQLCLRRDNVVK